MKRFLQIPENCDDSLISRNLNVLKRSNVLKKSFKGNQPPLFSKNIFEFLYSIVSATRQKIFEVSIRISKNMAQNFILILLVEITSRSYIFYSFVAPIFTRLESSTKIGFSASLLLI